MKSNEGGEMRRVRGSETAEANGPGYESAAHEKQGSILAEGWRFVSDGNVAPLLVGRFDGLQWFIDSRNSPRWFLA